MFSSVVLGGVTCMMCYSLGWHRGHTDQLSTYDRRLFEMHRVMREAQDRDSVAPEEAQQARAAE